MTPLPDPNNPPPPPSPQAAPGCAALRTRGLPAEGRIWVFPGSLSAPQRSGADLQAELGKRGVPRPPPAPQPHGVGTENLPEPSPKPLRHRSLMMVVLPFTRVMSAQFSAHAGKVLGPTHALFLPVGFCHRHHCFCSAAFKGSLLRLFPYHRKANMVQGEGWVSHSMGVLRALFSGHKTPSVAFVAWGNAMPGLHPPVLYNNGCSSFPMKLKWPHPLPLTVGAKAFKATLADQLGKALFTFWRRTRLKWWC